MRLIETTVHCNAQVFLIMIDIEGKEDYHFPSGTVLSISDFLIPIYQVESAQSYYVGSYYPPQPWLCYRWIFHHLYANPQFYIQLVFKAPLCITLTISDQKIVSGSLFLTEKKILPNFFKRKVHFFFQSSFLVRKLTCKKNIEKLIFCL